MACPTLFYSATPGADWTSGDPYRNAGAARPRTQRGNPDGNMVWDDNVWEQTNVWNFHPEAEREAFADAFNDYPAPRAGHPHRSHTSSVRFDPHRGELEETHYGTEAEQQAEIFGFALALED